MLRCSHTPSSYSNSFCPESFVSTRDLPSPPDTRLIVLKWSFLFPRAQLGEARRSSIVGKVNNVFADFAIGFCFLLSNGEFDLQYGD